jgi:glycosidase
VKQTSPTIYEINTPIFLREVGERAGHTVTLADVPDSEWDEVARPGVNTVWFMGVWKRSTIARAMAKDEPWLKDSLPDLRDTDILGSAYSIQEYAVDELLGGNEGLAIARTKLRERGIGIIVDYVPNHVAIDHHWASEQPGYFLPGTDQELAADSGAFAQTPGGIFAKGKDPNFEPWSDVLQLNAFSDAHRQEAARTLSMIAQMSDGVRCDMAMLMMNSIFAQTWGVRAGDVPDTEYWPAVIDAARTANPDFIFIAEVYWGKEQELLDQGFDFCYDKELYDYLLSGSAADIVTYLKKPLHYQDHLLRFIENHDEERAAHEYAHEQHIAAATIMATTPGAHLYHDGQREGRKVRVPVHLGRRTDEPEDQSIAAFYDKLGIFLHDAQLHEGKWNLVRVTTGILRHESRQVLAWSWIGAEATCLFVVNYSDKKAHVKVHFDLINAQDITALVVEQGSGSEQKSSSVIRLEPWQVCVFKMAIKQ